MRGILVVMLAACAGSSRVAPPTWMLDEEPAIAAPPPPTFRWSQAPLECEERDRRSSIDTCQVTAQIGEDDHLVAVYAPISESEPRVAVIRYDGDTIGGPLRWQQHVDMGAAPHSAVLTIVRDAAIVAAISDEACTVAAIDTPSGRILGKATIVTDGARAVQVEGVNDFARIHVRTRDGGVVAVMHPRTLRVIAQRRVGERAIRQDEVVAVTPTVEQVEDIAIEWKTHRLVVQRGKAWSKYLRIVNTDAEKAAHRASLMLVDGRVIVTVHDPEDARIEMFAFERESGAQLWSTRVTGGSSRAFGIGIVRTELDDDQLLVYNSSHDFTCTVGLEDGIERACVDRPGHETVIDFPDDQIVTP
jgi:hypothetical protein